MLWFDNFLFNGEEIVKLRLKYLYEHVDTFYICEKRYTHQGGRKDALFFEKNADWFSPYLNKIVFITDETPSYEDSWRNENTHRNYSRQFILEKNKDVKYILSVCDCDEIPDATVVMKNKDKIYQITNNGAIKMKQEFFYYNLNWKMADMWYHSFFINDSSLLKEPFVEKFRTTSKNIVGVIDCGWHLSYFMTPPEIVRKIESFAHTECNKEEFKPREFIRDCIVYGNDIYKRGHIVIQRNTANNYPEVVWKFHEDLVSAQRKYFLTF